MQFTLGRLLGINTALTCMALVALLVACGDDQEPMPAATFLLSQAPPSTVEDYMLFAQEFSDGAAEIDKFIGAFSEAIRLDPNDSTHISHINPAGRTVISNRTA